LAVARAANRLLPYRSWRAVWIGRVIVSVPPDWGDPERNGSAGWILYNRPRRLRIDGDAVWYGSAIELRVSPRPPLASAGSSAMSEITKMIHCRSGPIFVTLAIANGVPEKQRRIAVRVLATAIPDRGGRHMVAPLPKWTHADSDTPMYHPRISGPVRRH
jgi:hypothetical protein